MPTLSVLTSPARAGTLGWGTSALVLMALISSQGCAVISDAPEQTMATRGVAPAESQTVNPSTDDPQTNPLPREIPPIDNVLPSPESEPAPPIAKLPTPPQPTVVEIGLGSWYGAKFHGKRTASGEVFNQEKFTAAHRTLPWGSRVKVTNLANGKSVEVRINDRGPFSNDRIIDVSRAAARALGIVEVGVTTVQVEWLSGSEKTNELVLQER